MPPILLAITIPIELRMELLTAVISGDRVLEVRVFAGEFLSVREEQVLTDGLCRLMNRADTAWKK